MKLVTGEAMAEIDRRTIEEVGIPPMVLMEKAGAGVACEAQAMMRSNDEKIMILCGVGNNGGDGLVAARYLSQAGHRVRVFVLGDKLSSNEAELNYHILENLGLEVVNVTEPDILWREAQERSYGLIIDAVLGIGARGQVRGLVEEAIAFMNGQDIPVLSVDIPSGLDSNTGKILGRAVEAERTVTFGLAKVGCLVYPGCIYTGSLEVVDIGIPWHIREEAPSWARTIDRQWAREHFPFRAREAYKGSCGRVLIIGGSTGMTGAPVLAAQAALRSGAGVVTLGVPASLNAIMESKLTEAMSFPFPEDGEREGYLGLEAADAILEKADTMDFVIVGPGLGRSPGITSLVETIIKECPQPLLLDADGINAIEDPGILRDRPQKTIITPHYGEMARLLQVQTRELVQSPLEVGRAFAQEWGVTLVLKGPNSLILLPEGTALVNTTGNPGMATAGSGDVLTGVIGGLMGQMISFHEATALGVYLHGRAGDIAMEEKGVFSVTAGDLVETLPRAWTLIEGEKRYGS